MERNPISEIVHLAKTLSVLLPGLARRLAPPSISSKTFIPLLEIQSSHVVALASAAVLWRDYLEGVEHCKITRIRR